MDPGGGFKMWTCLILVVSICLWVVTGTPIATTTIICVEGGGVSADLGSVDEGYLGDVELITGIEAGKSVKLEYNISPDHLQFVELSFTPGETTATVRTKKPLDADVLASYDSALYYRIKCVRAPGEPEVTNYRRLTINDINDNGPVFEKKLYTADVSETTEVDTEVLQITAVDLDISIENKTLTYTMVPATEDFILNSTGALILKRCLNYTVVPTYSFTVTASDKWGWNDTANVQINVVDFDNLNPYFSHNLYQAFIPENMEGPFRTILPEAIKAQDGDKGINMTLTYSISAVSPNKYQPNFHIDPSSGVLSVVTPIDRETMNTSTISVSIKAAQIDDSLKTAESVVTVTVEDVNDNNPEFDQSQYSVLFLENSPEGTVVFNATVTDLDQGGFDGTLRILPESAPFSISSDGTVRVKNSSALDRETTESFNFQIEATETNPPHSVVTVPVNVTLLDENDNSPKFSSNKYEGNVFVNQTEGMLLVQNITTIRVTVSDINDNRPEFSSDSYISSILLKDAEKGKLLLTLSATDKDDGNNSLITYSFIEGATPYLALNSETGEVTLTSNLTSVTEDTTLVLTAMAKDHGVPSLNSTVRVVVNLRVAILMGNVAFLNSSYNFSLPENQPAGVTVGRVWASSGSNLYDVTYKLKTHTDLFSVDASGAIVTNKQLDKEEQEWYFLEVEAVDTRVPPTSAHAMVRVQVEDVNEPPQFDQEVYQASIFSTYPDKSPVINVKATDTDVGDEARLHYSMSDNSNFDMDPSSGLVFVVSAADIEGQLVKLEVKATDPQGLSATTKVEVEVKGGVSTSDVVTISLNQPIHVVDKNITALEKSLGAGLGWTVDIIEVSSGGATNETKTLVNFIALNGQNVVPYEEVTKKLKIESNAVTAELVKLFGEGTHFSVVEEPPVVDPTPDNTITIVLGVVLPLVCLGLIAAGFVIRIKKKRKKKRRRRSITQYINM